MSGYKDGDRSGRDGARFPDSRPRHGGNHRSARSSSPPQETQEYRQRDQIIDLNSRNPNALPIGQRHIRERPSDDRGDHRIDESRDTRSKQYDEGGNTQRAHRGDDHYRPYHQGDYRSYSDGRSERPRDSRSSHHYDQRQAYRHGDPQVRRDVPRQASIHPPNPTRYEDNQAVPRGRESYSDRRRNEDEMDVDPPREPRYDQRSGFAPGYGGRDPTRGQNSPYNRNSNAADTYRPNPSVPQRAFVASGLQRGEHTPSGPSGQGRRKDGDVIMEETPSLSLRKTLNVQEGVRQPLKLTSPTMRGTLGRLIRVQVNHFEITALPQAKIFQYNVSFTIPETSQRLSKRPGERKISPAQIEEALKNMEAGFLGPYLALNADYTQGWTTVEIPFASTGKSTLADLDGHKADRPKQVKIEVRETGYLSLDKFLRYLESKDSFSPEVECWFKALNAIFRDDPATQWTATPNSSNFFPRDTRGTPITSLIETVHGIHQAIRYTFGRLTLNVDVVLGAFYIPDQCLLQILQNFLGLKLTQLLKELAHKRDHNFASACERLVGMPFKVKHIKGPRNARVMKVRRIDFDSALNSTFNSSMDTEEPKMTNVYNYYLNKYNFQLHYETLPLLVTNDGSFPIELCYTTDDKYKEQLSSIERSKIVTQSTQPADQRARQITAKVQQLDWDNARYPRAMGLRVSSQMLQLQARVLKCPQPQYQSDRKPQMKDDGSWNLRGVTFRKPENFDAWGVMILPLPRDIGENIRTRVESFCNGVLKTGLFSVSMRSGKPYIPAPYNAQGNIKQQIRAFHGRFLELHGSKPRLLCFVVHRDIPGYVYTDIKSFCEVELGVASQVMITDKIFNQSGQQQYAGNIAMKVNVKLGGLNSKVEEPLFGKIRTMILGGDITHPSPAECQRQPPPHSFCALTASHDRDCVNFTAIASAQGGTIELIQDFKQMFQELLKRYLEQNNNQHPEAIIYFRDGVSETQCAALKAKEEKELLEVCKESGQNIKVTLVVCTKRHHTRIFPMDPNDKMQCDYRNKNVFPGTIVEASNDQDVFLISHGAIKGTVRPTRYTVLLDQNQLQPNDFQRLVLNSCYTYGRATRGVSLTPAVYYADIVAERAKIQYSSLNNAPGLIKVHQNLTYTMFWQ